MDIVGFYQPKIKPNHGVVSYEGLIRSNTYLNIEQFILKQCDKKAFDMMILELFSKELATIKLDKPTSINVFGNSFYQSEFITLCEKIINNFNFALEVTEHEPIKNIIMAHEAMEYLTTLGVEFSLDDCGKGYSDITLLKTLPFQEVKVDKSLVKNIAVCKRTRKKIANIKAVAQDLGITRVVYEGVECKVTESSILELDDEAILQGYLYAEPRPILELTKFDKPVLL